MATLQQKIRAEQNLRELLADGEVRPPDDVEWGYTCIRAMWWEEKSVVRVDIDHDPDFDYAQSIEEQFGDAA